MNKFKRSNLYRGYAVKKKVSHHRIMYIVQRVKVRRLQQKLKS